MPPSDDYDVPMFMSNTSLLTPYAPADSTLAPQGYTVCLLCRSVVYESGWTTHVQFHDNLRELRNAVSLMMIDENERRKWRDV